MNINFSKGKPLPARQTDMNLILCVYAAESIRAIPSKRSVTIYINMKINSLLARRMGMENTRHVHGAIIQLIAELMLWDTISENGK